MKEYNWKTIRKTKMIPAFLIALLLLSGSAMASERVATKLDNQIIDSVTDAICEDSSADEELPEEMERTLSEEEEAELIVIPLQEKSAKSAVDFETTLLAGKSYTYEQEYYAEAGEKITINVICSEASSYQYGIKFSDGQLRYVTDSGTSSHAFEIRKSGSYYVWMKNMGNKNIDVIVVVDVGK